MTLHYLNAERYGIWLVVLSMVSWFGFMDIGLGNGLRNRFATALANGDEERAKRYVSSAYAAVSMIALATYIVFLCLRHTVPWYRLFNTPQTMNAEMQRLAFWAFTCFSARFVLQLIGTILTADQRPAYWNGLASLGNIITLIGIWWMSSHTVGSLVLLGAWCSIVPVLVFFAASVWLFMRDYRRFIPSLQAVGWNDMRDLADLGVKFFVLQIAGLVIFTTGNMVITQVLGPESVTPYGIASRYFNALVLVFGLITAPFWSAITEAYAKGDLTWMSSAVKGLLAMWSLFAVGEALMLMAAPFVLRLWVGPSVSFSWLLLCSVALFNVQTMFNSVLAVTINGVGKIRINVFTAVFGAIINLPLAVWLAGLGGLKAPGVACAAILSLLPSSVIITYHVKLILAGKDSGGFAK
jgi:O-antigen/teichoic acid export membrane protein